MSTNSELAHKMAQIADALATYDHLPYLHSLSVWSASEAFAGFAFSGAALRDLCRWAEALDIAVTIELSYGGSGEAYIRFALGGHPVKLRANLHSGQAYELGAALRRPISQDQPTITVSAADFQAAIAGGAS